MAHITAAFRAFKERADRLPTTLGREAAERAFGGIAEKLHPSTFDGIASQLSKSKCFGHITGRLRLTDIDRTERPMTAIMRFGRGGVGWDAEQRIAECFGRERPNGNGGKKPPSPMWTRR